MKDSKRAIILLHEIYGVNKFIQSQCQKFREAGYGVFCPNLVGKPPFPYEESKEAYDFFMENIGFNAYTEVNGMISQLKEEYANVFVIGYSVGATIAWRCSGNPLCSGIIACYGSRIRDYADLNPSCPTLLLFAQEDAFDVDALVRQLQGKQQLSVVTLDAAHGFMNSYSRHFNSQQAEHAEDLIHSFLNECTH